MTAVIVEDNFDNYQTLLRKIQLVCPNVKVVGHADCCAAAITLIQECKPELIFLDIELPDGKGFDVLKMIAPMKPALIFVTGYEEHIMRAFEFSAIDFLAKPVDPLKLQESVARAEERNKLHFFAEQYEIFEQSRLSPVSRKIALANQEMMIFKELHDIVFLEADGPKSQFYFKDYYMEVNKSLADYERTFAAYPFLIRASRSHIINTEEVRYYIRSDAAFMMSNGKQAYSGENYRSQTLARIREACAETLGLPRRIELSDQRIIAFPFLHDILYLEADGAFTKFYIRGFTRTFIVAANLKKFESLPGFARIHRSYIVQLKEVRAFLRDTDMLSMSNGDKIPFTPAGRTKILEGI